MNRGLDFRDKERSVIVMSKIKVVEQRYQPIW